jgi:DNA polymerase-1
LSKVLYDEMNFPRPKNPFIDERTGLDMGRNPNTKKYNSTMVSRDILVEKAEHPLAMLILVLREADKLQKNIENLLELQHEGRLHSNFNLAGTRTGRISSSRPNLQNLTSEYRVFFLTHSHKGELTDEQLKRKDSWNLRRYIQPEPGNVMISVDYKQMEMRMFGVVSRDPHMLEFLQSGVDIHSQIAARVWGEATEATRDWAKQIGFGLIYGMTMGSLRHRLNLTLEEARKITSDYWTTFPTIRPWLFGVVEECKRNRYLRYWSGRIWREQDESKMYKGANALIQGGCADLLSVAVLRLHAWIRQQNLPIRVVNLIHDEVLLDLPAELAEDPAIRQQIKKIMEVEDIFGIPFIVDFKIGDSYGNLRSIETKQQSSEKHIFA